MATQDPTKKIPFPTLAANNTLNPTPNIQAQIRSLFGQQGVPLTQGANPGEDENARLNRITREVLNGRSLGNVGESVGRIAAGMNPTEREANQRVGSEFEGQRREIERNLERLQQSTARDLDVQQTYGTYGRQSMNDVFSALNSQLNQNNAATQGALGQARQGVTGAYGQANAAIDTGFQQAIQAMQNNTQGLGIEAAMPDAVSGMRSDLQNYTAANESNSAVGQSVLNTLMGGLGGIGRQAVTDASLEGAQQRGNFETELMRSMADIGLQGAEGRTDLLNQLTDVEADKGARLGQLMSELGERDYQRNWNTDERDWQRNFATDERSYERGRNTFLDDLAAEIQRGTLNLQGSELDFMRQRFDKEFGLDEQRFGLEAELGRGQLDVSRMGAMADMQRAQAELAAMQPGSLEYQQKELEIQLMQRDLDAPAAPLQGRSGLDQYLASNPMSETSLNALNRAIDSARDIVGTTGSGDPIAEAMRQLEGMFPGSQARNWWEPSTPQYREQRESWQRMRPEYQRALEIMFGAN